MREMFQVNKHGHKDSFFMPVFIVSLTVSMLFIVLNQSELLLQSDVLSESNLSLINRERNSSSLFWCVLRERIWLIPIMFLISTTYLARPFAHGVVVWYGFSLGAIVAVAMLRYRFLGVLFLVLCGMPQYFIYIPSFLTALRLSMEQRTPDKKFYFQLFVLELMILVGCILESYVNSFFIEKIIQLFIGV